VSDVNLHISMTNLSRVDRLQNDAHKTPMVNQQQNAQLSEDDAARRMTMPVEAGQVEDKKVDPEDGRREQNRRRKNSRDRRREKEKGKKGLSKDGQQHFIDVQA
jgi:hypothetical protein